MTQADFWRGLSPMCLISVRRGDDGSMCVGGELDITSRDDFLKLVHEQMPGSGDVVLELRELSFVDVAGMRAIVTLAKQLWPRRLILRNPSRPVARVLEMLQIDGRLGIDVRYEGTAADEAGSSVRARSRNIEVT